MDLPFLFCLLFHLFLANSSWAYSMQSGWAEDRCETDYGTPVKCLPDFVNAAFSLRGVWASETCGIPPQRYCDVMRRPPRQQYCEECDESNRHRMHPIRFSNDFQEHNTTCWRSKPHPQTEVTNVTVVFPLNKKFDITYISLSFCTSIPDSFAIYRSTDYGKSWKPYQFYSSDCMGMYGKEEFQYRTLKEVSRNNEQEVLCYPAIDFTPDWNKLGNSPIVIFSTLELRPSASRFDKSPALLDWVVATDIKIEFKRLSANSSTVKQPGAFSLADTIIGGRCACNGHASQCVRDSKNQLTCNCKHNTAGRECERCKPFHFNVPWGRADADDAHVCMPCNCNMHAKRCRFDKDLYLFSGQREGGVCQRCRHHTAGRYCHYCAEGYARDYTVPITHKKACKACSCHPVGAAGKKCNHTNGQCTCKPGVAGKRCDRCQSGYKQTRKTDTPCIKIARTTPKPIRVIYPGGGGRGGHYPAVVPPRGAPCDKKACRANRRKINSRKWCQRDFALRFHVIRKYKFGEKDFKFTVRIQEVFKGLPQRGVNQQRNIFVTRADHKCKCPRLRRGESYLAVGYANGYPNTGLFLNRESLVVKWKEEWRRRIKFLMRKQRRNQCPIKYQ